jgi:hypothetical protein
MDYERKEKYLSDQWTKWRRLGLDLAMRADPVCTKTAGLKYPGHSILTFAPHISSNANIQVGDPS